ncbi:MAG TPA: anthranilate synthase component I [Calditrichia bacterium]|nr:anthranilate synthase component I [Calditrichia bacterium]
MQVATFEEFQQLAMHGNVIPLATSMVADLLTPVSAFMKLCGPEEEGFLLESVEGGETMGRYSFLGHQPRTLILFDGEQVTVSRGKAREVHTCDIFTYLKNTFSRYRFVSNPDLPRFVGGLVGYFGYDAVRFLEKLPEKNATLDEPIAAFGLYQTVLAFDHLRHQIHIVTNVFLEDGSDLRACYDAGIAELQQTRRTLMRPLQIAEPHDHPHSPITANFEKNRFCEAVRSAKDYIKAGDIFQVVLSQKFTRKVSAPPIDVYRALRLVNPSPYLYFLKLGDRHIIGSSPEMLVRVDNGEITVRPIAGTRPRGRSQSEDARLAADLLADEKERAEHVMLVDLGRNDVGRASQYGSVNITENMIVERYSHVMHIVSEVRGRLREDMDAIDALKAAFPAGTVSGAPKVRAMEIIEELEPQRRGLYAGALGYLDFSGNLDTCIAIRTLVMENGVATFQAGAGIVADSDPEREFQETVHKSNALRSAIALAEAGLDE